ncbi:DUF3265 domain-containing protein [Vibrio parahaemolyticus]|nr:DUF3265 domain-containing protein [Vibrio parahaemolyticus]ELA7176845.1 DUF3265 domain-containing protein [Vibrio parahaemolyticus]ELA7459334.1 DUF3265 domain-containing protein [Vibrio parahaemolyticus]ELA7483297.1 DUF3265 domain-containing protein [Vibrio parahaemolyticus]ELA7905837.1 DUF3265 domain-containing protein [Vibrio parahaemolyticus]
MSVRVWQLTNASRRIRNAWHFYCALILVIKVVCGNIALRCSPLKRALAKLSKLHLKEAKGIEFEKWIFCPMRPLVGKSWS